MGEPRATGPWAPLAIRVYRYVWIAALVSNVGSFMHIAAASWQMTLLTDSPTLIGLVQTAWAVPGFLLALHAGAITDIVDRTRLLYVTEIVALAIAAILGVLVMSGSMSVSVLLAGTFLESVVMTLSAPVFMAATPQFVGRELVPQALGLDAASRNIAQTVGPALAGLVIAASNAGVVFVVNAVSFVGILFVAHHFRHTVDAQRRPTRVNAAIREGLVFVWTNARTRGVSIRILVVGVTSSGLLSLMPVVASQELRAGSFGYGVLAGALGLGSVLGILVVPRLRERWSAERLVVVSSAVWGLGVAAFAGSGSVPVAVACVVVVGAAQMATMNTYWSRYLLELPDWLRGRGTSLSMLVVWFGMSVGSSLWSSIASSTTVGVTLVVVAVLHVAAALIGSATLRLVESN
jgi:MFS family permease